MSTGSRSTWWERVEIIRAPSADLANESLMGTIITVLRDRRHSYDTCGPAPRGVDQLGASTTGVGAGSVRSATSTGGVGSGLATRWGAAGLG